MVRGLSHFSPILHDHGFHPKIPSAAYGQSQTWKVENNLAVGVKLSMKSTPPAVVSSAPMYIKRSSRQIYYVTPNKAAGPIPNFALYILHMICIVRMMTVNIHTYRPVTYAHTYAHRTRPLIWGPEISCKFRVKASADLEHRGSGQVVLHTCPIPFHRYYLPPQVG